MFKQSAVYIERSKREVSSDESSASDVSSDESSASDVSSDESSASDATTDATNGAISAECARLASYVEFELSAEPDLPETFDSLPPTFDLSVIRETAPAFFNLSNDVPLLLSSLSIAINTTSDVIAIPPPFRDPSNLLAIDSLAELAADFVVVANESCGISLNQTQLADVNRLFGVVLPVFFVFSRECDVITLAIVEQAIADALATPRNSAIAIANFISDGVGVDPLLSSNRQVSTVLLLILGPNPPDVPAAAQAILDDFLFVINDFCGIPPLSPESLALLDRAFLDELVRQA